MFYFLIGKHTRTYTQRAGEEICTIEGKIISVSLTFNMTFFIFIYIYIYIYILLLIDVACIIYVIWSL